MTPGGEGSDKSFLWGENEVKRKRAQRAPETQALNVYLQSLDFSPAHKSRLAVGLGKCQVLCTHPRFIFIYLSFFARGQIIHAGDI